jgi:hypothetical protein
MWRFHWERYGGRRAGRIFLDSAAGVEKWRAVAWGIILLILWLLGPPVEALAVSVSQLLPGWVVPVFLLASVLFLFVRGLLKENYENFQEEEQKREQVEAEKVGLEKKLATAAKRKALRNLLGNALREGRSLSQGRKYTQEELDDTTAEEKYQEEIRKWVDDTYDLIEAAFGTFEAQHFIGNEDYKDEQLIGRKPQPSLSQPRFPNSMYFLKPRLKRLREIRPRMHLLEIDHDFDPQDLGA